jgi:Uma2 family endonuclease
MISSIETLADLIERLGDIPLARVRFHPFPGTATEADVLARPNGEKCLCELVDGVLVEKAMGLYESLLAVQLGYFFQLYLDAHPLGVVAGEAGMLRLAPGLVRAPDVSFLSWDHFPDHLLPADAVPGLAPDLAVEILSESNTEAEMERKRDEYFSAGTKLTWLVDPSTRTVRIYTNPTDFRLLQETDTLDGGDVLPGFTLSIRTWFERAGQRAPR